MKPAHVLELPGLVGGNPLGFLAALGTLRALTLAHPTSSPRLAWSTTLKPSIHTLAPLDDKTLISHIQTAVNHLIAKGTVGFNDIIKTDSQKYDTFVNASFSGLNGQVDFTRLLFAAAFGTSAVIDKENKIIPNALSFTNGQGTKLLLKDFRTLVGHLTADRLRQALFERWAYLDEGLPVFRWDPQDMRTGAHMATDPGPTPIRSVAAANTLAFVGISFLVSVPSTHGLLTTGIRRTGRQQAFTWPLWSAPLGVDVITSLLQQKHWESSAGIFASFAAPRIEFKKNLYLGNAIAMDGSSPKE